MEVVSIASIKVRASSACNTGVLPRLWVCFGPPHSVCGIEGEDLTDHHPVEEHPESCQPHLHGGFGLSLQLQLDEGRDMNRFDLGEVEDADLGTKSGELPHRFHVGTAGVGVADVRGEEVSHPRPGFRPRRKDGGQGRGDN